MSGNKEYIKMTLQGVASFAALLAVMFGLAGTVRCWKGWLFALVSFIGMFVALALFKNKTELIKERRKPGPGTKWWDKVFWAL